MIWASTLQIQNHRYYGDLDFIILFIGVLSLYVINLDVVSLFVDSSVFSNVDHIIVFDVFHQFK